MQTSRHVAFTTTANGATGRLQFESIIEGEQEYFVPRLIAHRDLQGKGKGKVFPTEESGSIALYLGLKLMHQGGVAIYVKAPNSAAKIIRDAISETIPRLPGIRLPSAIANESEINGLATLYTAHFGEDSYLTKGAKAGIFAHTGETPQGIRLAIEHAMREALIPLIVCTSTLAQGVNLPIRYLLVTSQYQNSKVIKTRDFQNLIGRAGRAGMYGEGTVIFTNPTLYDTRTTKKKDWAAVQKLLKSENSAPTSSTLLRLVRPIFNRFETKALPTYSASQIIDALIIDSKLTIDIILRAVDGFSKNEYFSRDDVLGQLNEKTATISAIETFLMANEALTDASAADIINNLVEDTFAYHLANSEDRELLISTFQKINSKIEQSQLGQETRLRYSKALLGLEASKQIDAWIREHLFTLQLSESPVDVLDEIWDFLDSQQRMEKFHRLEPASARRAFVESWISGQSFKEILSAVTEASGYIRHGTQERAIPVETIVGMSQDQISFQACLIVSAMSAAFESMTGEASPTVVKHFENLNKMLKYGLASMESIAVYEVGFADRFLSQAISQLLPSGTEGQGMTRQQLRANAGAVRLILSGFPDYFSSVLSSAARS